jgi:hypothetical protein
MTTRILDPVTTEIIEKMKAELAVIEDKVVNTYTLADAIREGSKYTEQKRLAWYGDGEACALSAAYIALRARGLL